MNEIDRQVYQLAKGYLPSLNIAGVTSTLIENYVNPFALSPRPTSKHGLFLYGNHLTEVRQRRYGKDNKGI